MRIGVIVFPGSNCDQDMVDALSVYPQVEVKKLWHKAANLEDSDLIVLPGGFSYGDYLRSGAIARFSPIMTEVIRFANSGGFVFGVCNGFQILCESQLLPGALLHNTSHKFICENVNLVASSSIAPISSSLKKDRSYLIPIAHGEGRYYADENTIQQLVGEDRIIFKYSSAEGIVNNESNPNGSLLNIAGVCSEKMNVFGMMPHPERAADPILGNNDGRLIISGFLQKLFSEEFVLTQSVSM
ncbi:MAG: phosphoribosylformylglycinamidine synthase subunit PurQ [Bacteroidia bacterium]